MLRCVRGAAAAGAACVVGICRSPSRCAIPACRAERAPWMICVICGAAFEPTAPKSSRRTCSRSCRVVLAWQNDPEKRLASLRAAKRTPEARAKQTEANHRRWAQPGQRERLATWNRQRWADPDIKAQLSAAIRAGWDEDRRAAFGDFRRRQWAENPAYRAATTAGIRKALGSPEHRAMFSRLLRARWQDPAWRERWAEGTRRRMCKPENRKKFSDLKRAWWQRKKMPAAAVQLYDRTVKLPLPAMPKRQPFVGLITGPDPFRAQRTQAILNARKGRL